MDAINVINVTDAAWARIKAILPPNNDPKQKIGLRIKVVGGGCSGLSYKMEPSAQKAGDKTVEKDGCFVFIDLKSLLYVKGMTLDYHDELMHSEFVIENPNVKSSCGCGKSFST